MTPADPGYVIRRCGEKPSTRSCLDAFWSAHPDRLPVPEPPSCSGPGSRRIHDSGRPVGLPIGCSSESGTGTYVVSGGHAGGSNI